MSVRAKFVVEEVLQSRWNPITRKIKISAVMADEVPENQRYHKYTPSGSIEIMIDNPLASEQLVIGKMFYVDFTEA